MNVHNYNAIDMQTFWTLCAEHGMPYNFPAFLTIENKEGERSVVIAKNKEDAIHYMVDYIVVAFHSIFVPPACTYDNWETRVYKREIVAENRKIATIYEECRVAPEQFQDNIGDTVNIISNKSPVTVKRSDLLTPEEYKEIIKKKENNSEKGE